MGQPNRGSAGSAHESAPVMDKSGSKTSTPDRIRFGGPGGAGVRGTGKGAH